MSKRRAFRPDAFDRLEDRLVLSRGQVLAAEVAAAATANVNTQFQPLTFNYQQVAGQINTAFNNFRTDYNTQLVNFLNSGAGGTTTTLDQLRAFTTQRVNQLVQEVQTALLPIPGAAYGLTPFILNEINGKYGGDLLSTLNSIPGNTGPNGGPSGLYPQIANLSINTTQLVSNDLLSTYSWALGQGQANFFSGTQTQSINFGVLQSDLNRVFNSFRDGYNRQLSGFLNPTSGNMTTLGQLQQYNTQQLGPNGPVPQQLQAILNQFPGASSGLTPFILNQVNGQFGGDLLASLNNLPGNTGPNGGPEPLYGLAANQAINATQLAANDLMSAYNWGLSLGRAFAGLYVSGGGSNVINPNTRLSHGQLAALNNDAARIRTAFQTFGTAYNNAVKNVLFDNVTLGPGGTVDLTGNQSAFNTQVGQALTALNQSLGNIFANTPRSNNSLVPSFQPALLGPNSLQSQLAGLVLPFNNGTSSTAFTTNSNFLINQAYQDAIGRMNLFGLNNGFNFTPYGVYAGFLNGPFGTAFRNYPVAAGANPV